MIPQYLRSPEESHGADTGVEKGSPQTLLEQLPGAVLLLGPEGRIVYLNGTAELRLARVRSELIGRDLFREVLPQLELEGWGERFRGAMLSGTVSFACDALVDGGQARLVIRSYQSDGARGAFVLVEDRAALAAEEERRKRAERLAAVGELAMGVAHEINNPLASIRGFAQLLARDLSSPEQTQALEIISQECSRVAQIVDNLLSFADQQRSEARGPLNLSQLAGGMLELRQYPLETSGVEIERDLHPALPAVHGERAALQRAVLALLARAELSLAASGSPERRLVVRTRESTEGVVLCVMDNGPGVPLERLKTLFSRAVAADSAGGVGLGGAFTIVREHGGHLWAESVEGRGTAFYMRLPRWDSDAPPAPLSPALAPPSPAAAPPRLRSLPNRSLRVLVADDEPTLRLAISLFLGRHGHEAVQAADAHEALQLASQQSFDVILADARMPGDGLQLLEKLEAMPEFRGRTILMTGAYAQGGEAYDAASQRPFLAKPFDMTEVISLVESVGR